MTADNASYVKLATLIGVRRFPCQGTPDGAEGQPFDISDVELRRFAAKVTVDEHGCWIWKGAQNSRGYGCLGLRKRQWLAHRLAYTVCVRPIPEGLHVDHLCGVRTCVNPAHLEPVTCAVNNDRAWNSRHLRTPEKRMAATIEREAMLRADRERRDIGRSLRACFPARLRHLTIDDFWNDPPSEYVRARKANPEMSTLEVNKLIVGLLNDNLLQRFWAS